MNNDSKELKDLLQSVAPESWDERADEALEVYDRYREVADAIEQAERAERALVHGEFPIRTKIASTKGWKFTDEMIENSPFQSTKGWKITDEMIDNLPFKSTKGLTLDDD